nr:cation:proton antiporter [Calditrichia bacterium]
MHETLLIDLSLIIVLGIAAQWIAWRLKIPSILILLVFGFLGGPVTGVLNPDHLFGELLFPVVSISVALILYEGGLTLKKSEIMAVGGVVRNLISIGLLVTWTLTTLCAYYILALSLPLAILFGAILVVTGPTVILPLLRMIRPRGNINSILKWEGMLNDPIGALLAVLVFESILAGGLREITFLALGGLAKMVLVGGGIGLLTGYLMMTLLRRRLVPEFLQNAVSISLVVFAFAGSNHFQAESGLFAVTLMGIFLANQKKVTVAHIIEFKENLRVLLLSGLFILLAARLERDAFAALGWQGVFFLVALITVVRPAAIFLSTMGSGLNWREKVFLSAMAPRGIVA